MAGRATFGVMGVLAEFERSMIHSRIHAGTARARIDPRKGAKAFGRPRVSAEVETVVRAHLASGVGICKTACTLGNGVGTVQRLKHGMVT